MKTVLLKPQREAVNAVLAYQDEGEDQNCSAQYSYSDGVYEAYWACDAVCKSADCWLEEGAGDCTLFTKNVPVGPGKYFAITWCH